MSPVGPRRRALVVSLRMAPGLAKEFVTLGEHLRSQGWEVRFLVASGYRGRLPAGFDTDGLTYLDVPESRARAFATKWGPLPAILGDLIGSEPFDYVTCYNPHPLNARLMGVLRRHSPRSRRSVVLHEPWVPWAERRRYGWLGMLKLLAVDFFSYTLLRECTDVVLPSAYAQTLYGQRPLTRRRVQQHVVPLCIPDLPDGRQAHTEPPADPYLCFVGTINPARRVDDVFTVAQALHDSHLGVSVKVLTRQSVSTQVPNVDVIPRETISDDDISELVGGALALFLPHTAASQSGNVPVAFRVATPILAFDIPGLAQHVRTGETGVLMRRDHLAEDVVRAVEYVLSHNLRPGCRQAYEAQFAPATLQARYAWLTGEPGGVSDG